MSTEPWGEFVHHHFGTWFGLLANANLVATSEVELIKYPLFENDLLVDASGDPGMYPFDLAFDIVDGTPPVDNGRITLSDEPGLGLEVDLDAVEEYPFEDGPWTELHYDEG